MLRETQSIPQSKDPYPYTEMSLEGVLLMNRVSRSKSPVRPEMTLSRKGSFDCVAARCANCNSAQDDVPSDGEIAPAERS